MNRRKQAEEVEDERRKRRKWPTKSNCNSTCPHCPSNHVSSPLGIKLN